MSHSSNDDAGNARPECCQVAKRSTSRLSALMCSVAKITSPQRELVSMSIDIDRYNSTVCGSHDDNATQGFLTVPPGPCVISGNVKLNVSGLKKVVVSGITIVFSTVAGACADKVVCHRVRHEFETYPGTNYLLDFNAGCQNYLNRHEIVLAKWTEFDPGSYSLPFSFPFDAAMPNTLSCGINHEACNITHRFDVKGQYRIPGLSPHICRVSRILPIFRHLEEEAKAVDHARMQYHQWSQQTSRSYYCGDWSLHVVAPTYGYLGKPLSVYFAAEVRRADGYLMPVEPKLFSCRLIETMEFVDGNTVSRQVSPWSPFRLCSKRAISVDSINPSVVSFDESSLSPTGRRIDFYKSDIRSSSAHPRMTTRSVSIIHRIDFRIKDDFGGILPGETHTSVCVRMICACEQGFGSSSSSSRPHCSWNHDGAGVMAIDSPPLLDTPPPFFELYADTGVPEAPPEYDPSAAPDAAPRQ
ncbi:hypothetical protein HDU90_001951 [Geranomyces variabilis]|nr:hypothetical protein HDU90_001951 [Geranomyces variabilis]